MKGHTGELLFALQIGVLLAAIASWLVASAYRRRMLALMRGGPAPQDASAHAASSAAAASTLAPARARRADLPQTHRRASQRALLAVAAVCLLIGLTQSWLSFLFVYDDARGFTLRRVLVLGLVYAWPMVMGWGLLRRWSWGRVLAGIGAYLLVMAVVVMLNSTEQQTWAGVMGWLGSVVVIPMVVALLISASGRIRAVAPYLLPIFLVLSAASTGALSLLAVGVQYPPVWIIQLVGVLGAWPTIVLLALLPWLLLAWPVWRLGLWLAQAYRDKRFSDLGYLLAAYWFVILVASALPAVEGAGWLGFTQLLPWLWLPLLARWLPRWLAPDGAPPTLLVLRVFQQDAAVEALFDRVIERWRLTGNTVLIAGTDLISRTLDPDDLFTFLNGRLGERFIASPAQVPQRLADFDLQPDPDGRYRVNECYCFDSTWQAALAALVQRADVVLMDLRGFQAKNAGCRHELGVLSLAPNVQRVVLLHDERTDRAAADSDIAAAPEGRFVWVDAGRLSQATVAQILGRLLA
ncbi:hypothetical protein [Hydrogenophaga sp.]|uniref:hypothetical protein n=1 Tax=Hydrogenophaga sp. TaxID=1904254 RepID=UPI00286E91A7|nr:hypothetical protein [Hydrogenophaga sp.]